MLILVTGGSRSGKSGFALEVAARFPDPRVFLATAQESDEEMKQRIQAHRRARPDGWRVVEEPREVAVALRAAIEKDGAHAVIVDCVTIWISNLLIEDDAFGEVQAAEKARELADGAARTSAGVVVVTNEVGSGVVPDNALTRRFRDCAGRANQVLAREAAEVYLCVSGIPVALKDGPRKG